MIPCTPTPPPQHFNEKCQEPGLRWLEKHPKPVAKQPGKSWRPCDYWSPFRGHLAEAFRNLCAYSAMYEPVGTVDHFVPCDIAPDLAYDWSNFRFASALMNSSRKNTTNVLDPFQVGLDWFEISLPDLQLSVTEAVPAEFKELAEFTILRLPLRDDERVLRQRRNWYEMYLSGDLPLSGLYRMAPLIAKAVEKQLNNNPNTP